MRITQSTTRVHTLELSDAELAIIEKALDEYTDTTARGNPAAFKLWDAINDAVP